jgi:mRNA interferase YafQ
MRKYRIHKKFRKDIEKLKLSGRRDIKKLRSVMNEIISSAKLSVVLRDHPLEGKWKGCRDCHIEGDWILIYEKTDDMIIFYRTGSHSELF